MFLQQERKSIEQACAADKTFHLTSCWGKVTLKRIMSITTNFKDYGYCSNKIVRFYCATTNKDVHVERMYFDNDFWENILLELDILILNMLHQNCAVKKGNLLLH